MLGRSIGPGRRFGRSRTLPAAAHRGRIGAFGRALAGLRQICAGCSAGRRMQKGARACGGARGRASLRLHRED